MGPRRFVCFFFLLLGLGLAACGGSGSSGFDTFPQSENAAINQALQEQRCVARQGLTICPASQTGEGLPTGTPVVVPTRAATPTPAVPPLATPEQPPTATPTPLASAPGISTDVGVATPVPCTATGAGCNFTFVFLPQGFPPSAVYRIASRTPDPPGRWMIGPALTASAPSTSIEAPVLLTVPAQPADNGTAVQLAVLVFLDAQHVPPATVDELAASGANFAFVTEAVTVAPD